jgi:flagellar FliJ protein
MYRFNLESLLNYRRYQEEILQKELADFKNQLLKFEQQLRQLIQARRKYSLELHQRQKKGGTVSGLMMYFRYLVRLTADIEKQKQQVGQAKKQFEQKRRELLDILKKRKTLEKLKEKKLKVFQLQQLKKERDLLDEVASTRFSDNH